MNNSSHRFVAGTEYLSWFHYLTQSMLLGPPLRTAPLLMSKMDYEDLLWLRIREIIDAPRSSLDLQMASFMATFKSEKMEPQQRGFLDLLLLEFLPPPPTLRHFRQRG